MSNSTRQAPPLPATQPPLPRDENSKPPLPPDNSNQYQYSSIPPPHQNNLPLFPSKAENSQSQGTNPPLPSQPPLPTQTSDSSLLGKQSNTSNDNSNSEPSAKKQKIEDEELSEAEKTFDSQFKQWEEKFNTWKQQNANHPDKVGTTHQCLNETYFF